MNHSKFEYFLNAVHYCIWINEKKHNDKFQKILDVVLSPIPKYLFTSEYRKKFYKRKQKEKGLKDKLYNDENSGINIIYAHFWFRFFYSGYFAFFSYLLLGITYKYFGALLFPIPIALGYIPAQKAVFSKDRYLEYFRLFEKKDEVWQRKWSRIATIFIIGGIIMALLGIAATTLF